MPHPVAVRFVAAPFWRDARHYQIAALATLVIFNFGWIDFGARPLNSAFALIGALVTQIVCSRATGIPIDRHNRPCRKGGRWQKKQHQNQND